ncbi:GIY-YIG nuclease family protein [Litoribacter ruber]|uniref:GIY-YIG nuclease family protein n=1 Tax=Litoribacter ruber TaxID=702568 RepID=A0AAP2CJT9_9BACT|nr:MULTISPECIES: GIY-YIG nuclease family protein [Litoribacter]MBS9526023.1 GIY-YIG nuclease family protein [Litoribacter alkaliphilus]MBT0810187.1 GIY-YIG nuclease family protein [Litoribacter ruber]
MAYFLYILQSLKDSSYYIGSTENPEERLEKHNRPHKGYTGKKQPWVLVYTEVFPNKTDALKRELYLKRMKSKALIANLISKKSDG